MTPADQALIGTWRSRGYGWRLSIGPDGFQVSDVTEITEFAADAGGPGDLSRAFEPIELDGEGSLSLRRRGDVTTYWFDREGAARPRPPMRDAADPLYSFDALCRQFEENYAFFDLRGVDWTSHTAPFRARVDAGTTADELFGVVGEMLAPLADAHVELVADGRALGATSPIRDRKLALQAAFDVPAWAQDRATYTARLQRAFGEMFLGGRFKAVANNLMIYGEAAPGVGYVSVFGEFGYGDSERARQALDLPRPALEAASFLADELAGIDAALDEAATALAGMQAIIVDARLNYGGYDRLALEIAGRFTDRPRCAYRKQAFTPQGFVSAQSIEIKPRTPSLSHLPTFLLTSRQTASAGEILALGMMACPNVTRVGERTLGILSDNLYKRLPNGWELSLSNEVYQAPDGALYEATGIPPQVETVVFDAADVRGGFRHAVERAIALAGR